MQPVGTTNYDDESLLKLIKDVNELKPFAFYLVDTLGVMYRHDMRKLFYLIDSNLSMSIKLGFHSHNNLQMSFANAQEMMRLAKRRKIIIDSSCYGFDIDASANYAIKEYQKSLDYESARKKNNDIGKQLKLSLQGIEYEVITKSKYEI